MGRILRSRFLHFVVLGAILFAIAPREREGQIVIDAPRVDRAFRAEQARLGRVLTAEEKQRVLTALVDEELLYREGRRLRLDEKDPVVRARVAETMRRSLADAVTKVDPAELDRRARELASQAPLRTRLDVWFVAKDHPDAARVAEAAKGPVDRVPLDEGVFYTEEVLARLAGADVARAAFSTALGERSAPVASAWGFWLVKPVERRPMDVAEARAAALDELRARGAASEVARAAARSAQSYDVKVEVPAGEPTWAGSM